MNILHKNKNVLFLDIETTGLPTKEQDVDIIEVGIKFIKNIGIKNKSETLSQLYSINNNMLPTEITELTGITSNMLENKPHISEHIYSIQKRVDKADIIVAHNAPFDIKCLESKGLNFTGKEVFDTATNSRRLFPELPRHTMFAMCEFFDIINYSSHRAIHDVNAMIQIYLKITNKDLYNNKLQSLIQKHGKLTYTKK